MLSILGIITGLAGPIATIAGKIADSKIALAKAQTDDERNKINGEIEELNARKSVLIAEAGSRLNAIIRGLMATPVVILLWKLLVYDKALGQWTDGHTDPLGADLWKIITAVIAFYFLYDITARFKR
ncbi:3TM-type holin [Bradyrhizobium sp. BRP56]|uniref:3TM-type holin n=1 Tax=Bradyrhizobium sp. BRP56 TaxID=2793819 RepID=UPI001CD74F07|nr:3TM-type holin [Bradyrhizobium sp. BRP56]MCA1400041.1 hypothetical protein [Bradyrhizobium sp. BRP56]